MSKVYNNSKIALVFLQKYTPESIINVIVLRYEMNPKQQ